MLHSLFLFFLIPHSSKDLKLKQFSPFNGLKIFHPYLVHTSFIIPLEDETSDRNTRYASKKTSKY